MDERTRYLDDVFGWSQEQAEILRELSIRADLPNSLDLPHLIEEIESVGRSELTSVQSYIRLLFEHVIKFALSSRPEPTARWREEIVGFHAEILTRYSRPMRGQVDLDLIWRRAVRQAAMALIEQGDVSPALPPESPFILDELLVKELDISGLAERLVYGIPRPIDETS